nr:hypothetical protein [Nocardioides luteus]
MDALAIGVVGAESAVRTIQARGESTPRTLGHLDHARAKASATASSARSGAMP